MATLKSILPKRPDPERMRIPNELDCDHCNECGTSLDNRAFFCSDNCVRKMIKNWRYEQSGV